LCIDKSVLCGDRSRLCNGKSIFLLQGDRFLLCIDESVLCGDRSLLCNGKSAFVAATADRDNQGIVAHIDESCHTHEYVMPHT